MAEDLTFRLRVLQGILNDLQAMPSLDASSNSAQIGKQQYEIEHKIHVAEATLILAAPQELQDMLKSLEEVARAKNDEIDKINLFHLSETFKA